MPAAPIGIETLTFENVRISRIFINVSSTNILEQTKLFKKNIYIGANWSAAPIYWCST